MSSALWLLLRLQLTGWFRYIGRGLGTVRGALLLLVGLGVFIPWLFAVLIGSSESRMSPETLRNYGPAIMMIYCLLSVAFSPSERAVYFTPAEVQFLFAGPFTRREILVYKIILTLFVSVPTALLMGVLIRVNDGWLPAVVLGLLLLSIFMQLFTMFLGLLANAIGASMYTGARRIAGVVLAVLAALVIIDVGRRADWRWAEVGDQIVQTTVWQVVAWPLRSFFDALIARQFWPDLLPPLMIALGVNVLLVWLIVALDWSYQEASAASSARRYATIQRLRGRSVGAEPVGAARKNRWTLPSLPYLGGIGPVLWRQLSSAFRTLGRLMMAVLIIGTLLASWMAGSLAQESLQGAVMWIFAIVIWGSVFVTTLVPFDFRGDLDRIALLKTLPIVPWRMALGQLLTPVLLLTVAQWLTLAVLLAVAQSQWPLGLAVAAVVPLFNFVLIGLDNFLFLLFPVRLMAATPGDFQALGRNVLLSLGKLVGLSLLGMPALVIGSVVYTATKSSWLAVLSAAPVLVVGGVLLVPLVSLAYKRFDVGRDTPA